MARSWTADRILAAIQAWADRTGQLPTANEWREKAADGVARPTTDRVIKVFGSWSEAIEAAGFTPRGQGGQPTRASQIRA